MKFDALLHYVQSAPWFDLALLSQLSGEPKRQLAVQLHHWGSQGKLMTLRRGLYSLTDLYRKSPLSPLRLANELYRPSYLSGLWALSYYGIIPEKTVTYTSVTTRVTRTFQNPLGTYAYSSLKEEFFFGFVSARIGEAVWIAEPEKALLDYWHLTPGKWTEDRLGEMRFQNLEQLNLKNLSDYAERWASPRLKRAVKTLQKVTTPGAEKYRTL